LEFQLKQLYVIHNVETLLLKAVQNPTMSIIDGEYNGQFAKGGRQLYLWKEASQVMAIRMEFVST